MRPRALPLLIPLWLSFAGTAVAQDEPGPSHVEPPRVVSAPAAKIEGPAGPTRDIELIVTVDDHGSVTDAKPAKPAGGDDEKAALAIVARWTFVPARRGDQAIAVKIRVIVPVQHVAPVKPESKGRVAPHIGKSALPTATPSHDEVPSAVEHSHGDDAYIFGMRRSPSAHRGTADYDITVGALSSVPRQNAGELLKLAPGILLTNEGGDGHAAQVFLRGFDAREGQDVEFTIGGVPINQVGNAHANGYADLHFIIPELVHSLRVVEGPFDPRQGNFAVAGSADYTLGLARRGLTLKYAGGSFNAHRMLALWGPKSNSLGTFGGVELYQTDGFGQNRNARRGSAMGQYESRIGQRGSFRITAMGYAADYKSAGVLRQDDYLSGRKAFFDTNDAWQGGNADRWSLSGDLELKTDDALFQQQMFLIKNGLRIRENFTGTLLDAQESLQKPHDQRGDGLDKSSEGWTIGARGAGRWHMHALGLRQEIEAGYYARGDFVDTTQMRVQTNNQVPYKREIDLSSRLGNLGLYTDVNLHPTSYIHLRGGVRGDLFTYDILNHCAAKSIRYPSADNLNGDSACYNQQAYGAYRDPAERISTSAMALQPRASVMFGPFKGLSASLNYGKGVRSIDPQYVSQDRATPFASMHGYESGLMYTTQFGSVAVVGRAAYFHTKVDHDYIFSQTEGRNTLADGTTRRGLISALRATGTWFDAAAHVTLVRATFDDTGLLIPYVPEVVVRSDTSVFHALPWKLAQSPLRGILGLGMTFVGPRPLPYNERSNVIFTVDSQAAVGWRNWELGLSATNLFDARYRLGEYNYASNFGSQPQPTLVPQRHFSAGPPRALFVSLSVNFGGDP